MSKLPRNWEKCLIGDVTKIVGGGTPPSKDPANFTMDDTGIPWITPADLSGYRETYIARGARNLTEKGFSLCSTVKMPAGSVLFSSRAPIGYVAIAQNEISTNQGFKSFVLPEEINNRYVYYYLKHIKSEAEAMATGTTFKELSGSVSAKLPFVIAPFNEQKRIADKLDSLLARVNVCQQHLDRVPAIIKYFRQAVLTAATSGKLTDNWRKNLVGPNGRKGKDGKWTKSPLEKLCVNSRVITYGVIKLGKEVPNGTPCLRTSNVRWLRIDTDGMKRISPTLSSDYARTTLVGGEVLVNVRGTLGGVAVATPDMKGWNVSREVAVVPVDPQKVNPHYLAYWIGSNSSQQWLGGVEKGVAYIGINLEDLRNLPVMIPTMDEQAEIVRRVQSLLTLSDRVENRYRAACNQIERLTPSLLTKAFKGELVPQDPNDEPASVLLDRIRTERATKSITKKSEKLVRKPKMKKLNKDTLREIIDQLPNDQFSFEELRQMTSSDYETLKEIVFAMVGEAKPIFKQVFDSKANAMRFVRVK